MNISEQLIRDEGMHTRPYRDTVGKLTIGVGRNLDDRGISFAEASFLLENDIERARQALYQKLPWTARISDARRGALVNMVFNMGMDGLLGFKNTLALMEAGHWSEAATEMLDSKWARQVGDRAKRLSEQIRTDEWK